MHKLTSIIAILASTLVLGIGCNSDNPVKPQAPSKPLTLLQPTGGEAYHVGDQVVIRWTVDTALANKAGGLSSVTIQLKHDTTVASNRDSTIVQTLGNGSVFLPDTTYTWTIDDAHAFSRCKIVLRSYTDPSFPRDSSGVFSTK